MLVEAKYVCTLKHEQNCQGFLKGKSFKPPAKGKTIIIINDF